MSRDDLLSTRVRYAWLLEISGLTVRYWSGQAPPARGLPGSVLGFSGVDFTDVPAITAVGSQTSKLDQLGGIAEQGGVAVTLRAPQYTASELDPVTLLMRNGHRESSSYVRLMATLPHDSALTPVQALRDVTSWPQVSPGFYVMHVGVETLCATGTALAPFRFLGAGRAQLDTRPAAHLVDAALAAQPWVTSDVVTWTGRRCRLLRAAITGAALTTADYEEVIRGELDRPPQLTTKGAVVVNLAPLLVALKKRIGGDTQRTRLVRTHHLYARGYRSTVAHAQIWDQGGMINEQNTAADGAGLGVITVNTNVYMRDNTDVTLPSGHPRRSRFRVTAPAGIAPMEASGVGAFAVATQIQVGALHPSGGTSSQGRVQNDELCEVKAVDLCLGADEALLRWPVDVESRVNAAWTPGVVTGSSGAWADCKLVIAGDAPRLEAMRNGPTTAGPGGLWLEFRSDWEQPGEADRTSAYEGQGYIRDRVEVLTYGLDLADPEDARWPDAPEAGQWTRELKVQRSRDDNKPPMRRDVRGVAQAYYENGERHFLAESDVLTLTSGGKWVRITWTDPRGEQRSQVVGISAVAPEFDGGGKLVGYRYTVDERQRLQVQSFGDWPGGERAEIRAACRWRDAEAGTVLLELLLSGRGNYINSPTRDAQPNGCNLDEDDVWVETFLHAPQAGRWTLVLTEDTSVEDLIRPVLRAMGCCLAMQLDRETGRQRLALVPLGLEYAPDVVRTITTADLAVEGGLEEPVDAKVTARYHVEAGFDESSGEPTVKVDFVDATASEAAGGDAGEKLELKLRGLDAAGWTDTAAFAREVTADIRARFGRPRHRYRLRLDHGRASGLALGDCVRLELPRYTGAARVVEIVMEHDRQSAIVGLVKYGARTGGWAPALRVEAVVGGDTVRVVPNYYTAARHPVTNADQRDLDYWFAGDPCACVVRGAWSTRVQTSVDTINRVTREVKFAAPHGLGVGDTVRPRAYDFSTATQKAYVYVADTDDELGAAGDPAKDWA